MQDTLLISTVFIAGILSFLSPCIIPLLPVYFSIFASSILIDDKELSKAKVRISIILLTLMFVLGIAFCFVILGFGAGALGGLINSDIFIQVLGFIVIVLGVHQTGLVKIKWLNREKKINMGRTEKQDAFGVFLLGLTFSFGWTPCIGPVLAAILGLSANGGTAFYGGFLMAIYSAGFAIPFMILAIFSEMLLSKMKFLYQHLDKIKIVGGIVIIFMGVLLMTNSLNKITVFFGGVI